MNEKESILSFLNLPDQFGFILFIIALVLSLAPYFPGTDFVIIKIPNFKKYTKKILIIVGPISFVVVLILHIPLVSLAQSGSFQNFEFNNGTPGSDSIKYYCSDIWFAECEFDSEKTKNGKRSIRFKIENHQQPHQTGGTVRIFSSSIVPLDLSKAKVISA